MRRALPWVAGISTLAWAGGFAALADWPAHLREYQLTFFALAALVTSAALFGRGPKGRAADLLLFWGVAVLARAALVLHDPPFSGDIYRYLWDARVWGHGINPFRYAPLDPHLAFLRDGAIYPRINYPEIPTIYPLVDQLFFLLASWVAPGVAGLKALLCAVELLAVGLVRSELGRRGLRPEWALLFAWHPLALTETASNGHADALGVMFLVASVAWLGRRPAVGALALAASALSKWSALIVAPALRPKGREWGILVAVLGLGAFAFAAPGVNPYRSLGEYLVRWRWNDAFFWVFMQAMRNLAAAKALAYAVLAAWVLLVARRESDPALAARSAIGALLLLSPAVHPWYALWVLPLLALRPEPGWLWLMAVMPLAYGPWPHRMAVSQAEIGPGLRLLEYGPALGWWTVATLRASRPPWSS